MMFKGFLVIIGAFTALIVLIVSAVFMRGCSEPVSGFFQRILMALGNNNTMDTWLGLILGLGTTNLKCMDLRDAANTGAFGSFKLMDEITWITVSMDYPALRFTTIGENSAELKKRTWRFYFSL